MTTVFETPTINRNGVIAEFEAEFPGCWVLEMESRGFGSDQVQGEDWA